RVPDGPAGPTLRLVRSPRLLRAAVLAFFFQAEDGIRAFHVTGVQTCALPIYAQSLGQRIDAAPGRNLGPDATVSYHLRLRHDAGVAAPNPAPAESAPAGRHGHAAHRPRLRSPQHPALRIGSDPAARPAARLRHRSEEHTSELQ